uniref:ELMO domain containing 1 n=1 Tax=Scleropages formosus TaxID=113540 RepID=A0A8C9R3T4_SCLFO
GLHFFVTVNSQTLLWRALKLVMRNVTGRWELQRICHGNQPGARRTLKIGDCRLLQAALGAHLDLVEKVIDGIVSLKRIDAESSPQLGVSLQASLLQIEGYPSLVLEVEKLRREPYDCSNVEHEEMLLKVPPGVHDPLAARISKQRSSRMRNVETWPLLAYWLELLPLASSSGHPMQEFHRFWAEKDRCDIVEFNRVRSRFHRKILKQLRDPTTALCPHFSASDLHAVTL